MSPFSKVWLFTAINILNYLDRYLVNAVLPILTVQFALSHEQGGRIVSAFVIGYIIFSPLFGWLGDRYSRPLLMLLGVVCWSLATLGTSIAGSFTAFILFRILVGVGEASYGTIAPGFLKDTIPDPIKLNRALSIFFSAIPVGAALGFALGGLLAKYFSWQAVFLTGGIPGLLLAPLLLRYGEVRKTPPPQGNLMEQVKEIRRIQILRYAIGGYMMNSFALTGIAAFIATYGVSIGFSLPSINLAFGLILVGTGLVGTLLGGRISSSLASRSSTPTLVMLKFVGFLSLAATPALFAAFLVDNHLLFLVLCAIAELLIFAGMAPINSIIVLECPPSLVTFTQGLTILMINLFGSLGGPLLIGMTADHSSLALAMQLSTLAMFFSGAIWALGGYLAKSHVTTGDSLPHNP